MPSSYGAGIDEEWKATPEKIRALIHKRENDFHNGIKSYKEAAGFGQQVAKVMLPYQNTMRQYGVHPVAVVGDIMKALNTMATGAPEAKLQTFLQLAKDYDIDIGKLHSLPQQGHATVAPEIAPVLQRVQQLESHIQTQEQEREQQELSAREAIVQKFLTDPKNEHAQAVLPEMVALFDSGRVTSLQEAYEKAIWMVPEVRAKLIAKQDEERRKREAEQAAAAKKAAAANVNRRGTPPASAKPGTMEDTARAIYRRHMSGN